MSNRVKILRVPQRFLLDVATYGVLQCVVVQNPLPSDAEILATQVDFSLGHVAFKIQSAAFDEVPDGHPIPYCPEPIFETRCPHLAATEATPLPITFTRDQLAELLYDADRQPGRRLTVEVRADGTWEARGL